MNDTEQGTGRTVRKRDEDRTGRRVLRSGAPRPEKRGEPYADPDGASKVQPRGRGLQRERGDSRRGRTRSWLRADMHSRYTSTTTAG